MSPAFAQWVETIFNITYLIIIWTVVLIMFQRRKNLSAENNSIGKMFLWAFLLLALGDTGHVGFRFWALLAGGISGNAALVGIGKLTTAFTVSLFYMIFVEIWRVKFKKERNGLWWGLMGLGLLRVILLVPSGNQWLAEQAPKNWALMRNAPLTVLGLGIAVLMLVNALKERDQLFKWVSIMIFVSYFFYAPVILFVDRFPMIGMLMIPKTLAYLVMAFLALGLFKKTTANS